MRKDVKIKKYKKYEKIYIKNNEKRTRIKEERKSGGRRE